MFCAHGSNEIVPDIGDTIRRKLHGANHTQNNSLAYDTGSPDINTIELHTHKSKTKVELFLRVLCHFNNVYTIDLLSQICPFLDHGQGHCDSNSYRERVRV